MWIDKLIDGVVALDTPVGARYVQPNLMQRAHLLWTFRNFFSLPQQVLRPRERRLIDRLWCENRFVSLSEAAAPALSLNGRVEWRTTVAAEVLPFRKPVSSLKPAAAEQNREAASA